MVSLQPQLVALHHAAQERVTACEFGGELAPRHHRGVDFAAQCSLSRCQNARQVGERRRAYDHHVHIARGPLGTRGYAAVHKGRLHFRTKRFEDFAQDIHQTGRLPEQL